MRGCAGRRGQFAWVKDGGDVSRCDKKCRGHSGKTRNPPRTRSRITLSGPVALGRPGAWMSERRRVWSHHPIYPHLTVWPPLRAAAWRVGGVLPCRDRGCAVSRCSVRGLKTGRSASG
ncbi:hypothetical protein VTI28DRAFT_9851 [Corynascus sepedonium]